MNTWPRPFQEPHPPIWVPSQGSRETIEWAAHPDRKYTYLQTYSPFQNVVRFHDAYRQIAHDNGYAATSEQLGWAAPVYVAETREAAIDEARPHVEMFFNKLLRYTPEMLLPPGYMSVDSYKRILKTKSSLVSTHTIESLMERDVIVVGDPDSVGRKLAECHARVGLGYFLGMFQIASLPRELTVRSMELFAREVMPGVMELEGEGQWQPGRAPVAAQAAE